MRKMKKKNKRKPIPDRRDANVSGILPLWAVVSGEVTGDDNPYSWGREYPPRWL